MRRWWRRARPGIDWRAMLWGAGWVLLLVFGSAGSVVPWWLRWLCTVALVPCVLFMPAVYFGGFAGLALFGRWFGDVGYAIGAGLAVFIQGFFLARYVHASRELPM